MFYANIKLQPSIDEIRSYELNRIRLAEGLVNLKSNSTSNRKSKKDKKKEKAHSLTVKNFTTPEEIVLEYLTAFRWVFLASFLVRILPVANFYIYNTSHENPNVVFPLVECHLIVPKSQKFRTINHYKH